MVIRGKKKSIGSLVALFLPKCVNSKRKFKQEVVFPPKWGDFGEGTCT